MTADSGQMAPVLALPPAEHHWNEFLMERRAQKMTDDELEATFDAHLSAAIFHYCRLHVPLRSYPQKQDWQEALYCLEQEMAGRWMRIRHRRRAAAERAAVTRRWKKARTAA